MNRISWALAIGLLVAAGSAALGHYKFWDASKDLARAYDLKNEALVEVGQLKAEVERLRGQLRIPTRVHRDGSLAPLKQGRVVHLRTDRALQTITDEQCAETLRTHPARARAMPDGQIGLHVLAVSQDKASWNPLCFDNFDGAGVKTGIARAIDDCSRNAVTAAKKAAQPTTDRIDVSKFEMKTVVRGRKLTVTLDSDLPLGAEIGVSVTRDYTSMDGSQLEEYAIELGDGRVVREGAITFDLMKGEEAGVKSVLEIGKVYADHRVQALSDKEIQVRAFVPLQRELFGNMNARLGGSAIKGKPGIGKPEREVAVKYRMPRSLRKQIRRMNAR